MNPGQLIAIHWGNRKVACPHCGRPGMTYRGFKDWNMAYGHAYYCDGCEHLRIYHTEGPTPP